MDTNEVKKFKRRFRGYCPQGVDEHIEYLNERLQTARQENKGLNKELAEVRKTLKEFYAREQSLESALNQTKVLAEETKAQAEREAQLLVAEAELQGEKILSQAHSRLSNIHEDIAELKRQRVQFEVRLRSLVEAHLKLMDVERDRDRDLAELEDKIKILRTPGS